MSGNAISHGLGKHIQALKDQVKNLPVEEQIAFFERRYRRAKRSGDGVSNAFAGWVGKVIDELRAGPQP